MTNRSNDLNDSLDDLLGGPIGEVRTIPTNAPADYQPRSFDEVCGKCRGSGQTRWGACFKCKGAGKFTFKTSPETRAKARASATERKAKVEQATVESFKAEHRAAYEWLVATAPRWELAQSLLAGVHRYGSLTEKQMEIVTKGIARDAARAAERHARDASAPQADTAGIDRLKLAFDTAIANSKAKGRGLKAPRITVGGIVISPAKEGSKNPGALYVKNAGQYLGKILNGRFFTVSDCTKEQEAKVLAFVQDPKAAAIAYGIETGTCCICNATLTNKGSIEAGIGPICAENFGWS